MIFNFGQIKLHVNFFKLISGAKESDYPDELGSSTEASLEVAPVEPKEDIGEGQEEGEDGVVGRLTFVSCATGSAPPPTASPVEEEEPPIHTPRSVSAIELHCEF